MQDLFDRIESSAAQIELGWIPAYMAPSRRVDPRVYQHFMQVVSESPEFAELCDVLRTDVGQRRVAQRLITLAPAGADVLPHPHDIAITLYLWAFDMRSFVGREVSVLLESMIRNLRMAKALWGEIDVFGELTFNTEEEIDDMIKAEALAEPERSLVLQPLTNRARERAERFRVRAAALVERWTRTG